MPVEGETYIVIAGAIIFLSFAFTIFYLMASIYPKLKEKYIKKPNKLVKLFEVLFIMLVYLPLLAILGMFGFYILFILIYFIIEVSIQIFNILLDPIYYFDYFFR